MGCEREDENEDEKSFISTAASNMFLTPLFVLFLLFSFQQQRRLDLLTITNSGKCGQTWARRAPLVATCGKAAVTLWLALASKRQSQGDMSPPHNCCWNFSCLNPSAPLFLPWFTLFSQPVGKINASGYWFDSCTHRKYDQNTELPR